MKTNSGAIVSVGCRAASCLLLAVVAVAVSPPLIAVESIQVLALMRDRAILSVDGERRMLHAGETSPEGVELLQSTSAYAVVAIDGREQRLEPGPITVPVGISPDEGGSLDDAVVLWADSQGFFHADGAINGHPVRFLVDTGANTIAMSRGTAREIGIDLSEGQRGMARTASGVVDIVGVQLDEVSVGHITLHNVSAGIIDGDHPAVPLLGASFLNHVEMRRAGARMELLKK